MSTLHILHDDTNYVPAPKVWADIFFCMDPVGIGLFFSAL